MITIGFEVEHHAPPQAHMRCIAVSDILYCFL